MQAPVELVFADGKGVRIFAYRDISLECQAEAGQCHIGLCGRCIHLAQLHAGHSAELRDLPEQDLSPTNHRLCSVEQNGCGITDGYLSRLEKGGMARRRAIASAANCSAGPSCRSSRAYSAW